MEATMEKPRTKTRKKRDKQKHTEASSSVTHNDNEEQCDPIEIVTNPKVGDDIETVEKPAELSIHESMSVPKNVEKVEVPPCHEVLSEIEDLTIKDATKDAEPIISSAPPNDESVLPKLLLPQVPPQVKTKELTFHDLNRQFEKEKRETLQQLENAEMPAASTIRPFTDSQLAALYANEELSRHEAFIADFLNAELKGTALKQHPLYELLATYMQARKNAKFTLKEVAELKASCEALQKELWHVENVVQRKRGECADGNAVYASVNFNRATFSQNNFMRVKRDKSKIQEIIGQSHVFYSYVVQVTKLQIECYIQNIINGVLAATHLDPTRAADVALSMQTPPPHVAPYVADLRLCVSILFQFQRKFVAGDPEFVREARGWLGQLLAVLLRLATWQDHLFVLSHVLRCPPGVATWAARFVQAPIDARNTTTSPFADHEINHIVTLLATILKQIDMRDVFLDEIAHKPDGTEAVWVVVDSDGEEDDETCGMALKENDLVSLLNQLPLQRFFGKILRFDERLRESALTQNHILQLFAFLSVLLKILQNGLHTYNQMRYLQLCKRLSRFMRHIVQYATDQLEIFTSSSEAQYSTMLERLQVEYDAFFIRAFHYLYVSEKLGSWQFLAVLPFNAITPRTLWKIFYFLHDFDDTSNHLLETNDLNIDYKVKLWTPAFRMPFEEHLSNMAEDECYYLLSTIANMALQRPNDEIDFIKCATLDLLHIGFVSEATQETCSKNVRILLTHITSKHTTLLADVFRAVQENIQRIGTVALYLYEELPISVWKISDEDLAAIENWLLHKPPTANESKLARMIISRLNWDLDESANLFLSYSIHCKVASLIVKAIEVEPSYVNWAWQTAVRLRLHMSDKGVRRFEDVKDIEYYVIIDKAVREQQPLAAFLALLISSWGHLIPLICSKGFDQLLFLQTHQKHEAVLFALHLIMPMFLNCQENLINLEKFQQVLVGLLNADRSYINMAKSLVVAQNCGTILEQFGNMIRAQIANYALYELENPRCVVRLWVDSLVSVTNWNRDHGVMHLLDVIVQSAFFHSESIQVVYETLRDLLQASTPQEQGTSLTSLFKWASSGTSQGNLLINTSLSTYPYLAVVIIDLEFEEREKDTNLWTEILQQIYAQKGKVNVDAAIKKATSKLKLPSFASGSMCLFRWAQQALDTPADHPINVLFWQKFFTLYLYHVQIPPNQTVCVGEKFFDGMINFNFLKRLKRRLQETVDHYKIQTTGGDFKHLTTKRQLYLMSAYKVFTAFSLWLEEPRLQEPSLYVPGIPPQYEPQLLHMILQGNSTLWLEYVDYDSMKEAQSVCIRMWNQLNFRKKKNINKPCMAHMNSEGADPWERIKRRLESYDTPKVAPSIVLGEQLLPALDVNDRKEMMRVVHNQVEQLTNCAHNFCMESSNHTAMNQQYDSLIVKYYVSITTVKMKNVPCAKPNNSVHCSGAAKISLQIDESRINENVAQRLEEFASEYEKFLTTRLQSSPVKLCYSSMFLQHVISLLEAQKEKTQTSNTYGVELFYHILSLMNEETSNYYPTKKLFTECLERLGQAHIHGVEEETPKLLDKILQDPNMGTYLAPHFSPVHVGTANFLMMYSMITKGLRQNYDLLYSLLSKFDVNRWLTRSNPKLSQRSQFIELVIKVLTDIGPEPPEGSHPLHELFRKHLVAVFQYQFPEHYGEILSHILKASTGAGSDCIAISVWLDILSTLAHPNTIELNANMREQLRHYAQHQNVLCYQVLMDTTMMLYRHYTAERLQFGLYGLYPKTSNYVEVISVFLGMTSHSFIVSALNTHQGVLGEKVCEIIWPYLRDLFAPWIVPYSTNNIKENMATWIQQLTDDRAVILPWIPANAPYAQKMVNMFFECMLFIIQTLPACNNIMSYFWQWYVTNFAHPVIKEHVFSVIHQAFAPLPWLKFWPTVHDIELMLKVAEQYLPECHLFLGHIFLEIPWAPWMANLLANATVPVKVRMHHCLLSLIIKLCNEPNVQRNGTLKALGVLAQADGFEWGLLEPQSIQHAMDWYIMSCDPTVILKTDAGDLDVRLLNFISIVCYYNQPYDGMDVGVLINRQIYIKTFVKLVTVYISKHKAALQSKEKDLVALFSTQLAHVEHVVRTQQEMNVILCELLVIVNQPGIIRDAIVKYFVQWLSDKEGNGMIVKAILQSSGNYIVDIGAVAALYEVALNTYFVKNVNNMETVSWRAISNELKPYVAKYNALVKVLIDNGHLLTLHALLLEKIATCEDKPSLLHLCFSWMADIKINDAVESKLPLLWDDFLQIVVDYIVHDENVSGEFLHKFALLLQQLSEQKDGAKWGGLLGVIGIGKQSPDSLLFRFVCRALAGYLMSQLPETRGNPQRVRCAPNAPCAVGQTGGNAEVAKILLKMDFGQSQGKIKECAEKALKQIQDPQNSLHNVNMFLRGLLVIAYAKPYLKEI